MKAIAFLLASALPLAAQDLPPGLESARLLPGWVTGDGHRMTALELVLEPGWKTYWRSPGETGIPPSFDWSGSENMGKVTIHWPRPQVIESAGEASLGYHDRLVLPIRIAPQAEGRPIRLAGSVEFGLCRDICVPAHVALDPAPAGAEADPAILRALDDQPARAQVQPPCRVEEIEDGMRVTLTLPDGPAPEAAAIELGDSAIWSSPVSLEAGGGGATASAEFVDDSGKPFPITPAEVRLTLIADGEATEYQGCRAGG